MVEVDLSSPGDAANAQTNGNTVEDRQGSESLRLELESRPAYEDAVVLNASYDMSVKQLRDEVFTDNAQGGVYYTFLSKMRYFDIRLGAFTREQTSDGDLMQRVVSFKIANPMGSVGPKEVDAEDSQVIVLENACGMVMESSCKTSKVMYSNSFRVCVQHKLISDPNDGNKCKLTCTLKVLFIKSVMGMIKKQIRNETIKQMHKKYSALNESITQAIVSRNNSAPVNPVVKPIPLNPVVTAAEPVADVGEGGKLTRNMSSSNLKRVTSKSESKVSGWLLKRSNTLRKWNTRYCDFCLKTGRFEWRKRPDHLEPNGFMLINAFTDIQIRDIKSGPQGMEDCSFVITYEKRMYYFAADTDKAMNMWYVAIQEYIQNCSIVTVKSKTSFDDSPTMMVKFSIGECTDLDHMDREKISERFVFFKLSVGSQVKRSKAMKTSKSKCATWKQSFRFPIFLQDNPEIVLSGEECYGENTYSVAKSIGMASFPLWAFPPGQGVTFWACLRSSAHISSPISGKVRVHMVIQSIDQLKGSHGNLDWETENDVTLFDELEAPKLNGIENGNGHKSPLLPIPDDFGEQGQGLAGGCSKHPLVQKLIDVFLCCGGGRTKPSKEYQLLQELDDL